MKIIIESDDLTLADVKVLGLWVRDRFKGTSAHGDMWVEAPEVTALDAVTILREIFGEGTQTIQWMVTNSNGK